MKSPKNTTDSGEEGAIIEIQENFRNLKLNKNQSTEEFAGNISFEKALNLDAKCDEFLGESEDSTEISFILSSLSSSNFSSYANSENNNINNFNNFYFNNYNKNSNFNYIQRTESENDSENTEILNILTRHPNPIRSVPCRGGSYGNWELNVVHAQPGKKSSPNAPALRPIPIKKISMAGKVLTSMDSTKDSESVSPVNKRKNEFLMPNSKPERTCNPLYKKNNIRDFDNNFNVFEKFQLNKL